MCISTEVLMEIGNFKNVRLVGSSQWSSNLQKHPSLEMSLYYFLSLGRWICTASSFDWKLKSRCRHICCVETKSHVTSYFCQCGDTFSCSGDIMREIGILPMSFLIIFPLLISFLHDTNFLIIILSNWFLQSMRMQLETWFSSSVTTWSRYVIHLCEMLHVNTYVPFTIF